MRFFPRARFALLVAGSLLSLQAVAQDVPQERAPITVSVSWTPLSPDQRCRISPAAHTQLKYVEKRFDQFVEQQFVARNGALAWICIVPVAASDRVIRQGDLDFAEEYTASWTGTSLFAEAVSPTKTRLYRVTGSKTSYADIDGPYATQSPELLVTPAANGAQETANLIFDQSGTRGGIYVFSTTDTAALTFWPDADFIELEGNKPVGRRICDGRKLWGKDAAKENAQNVSVARCQIVRHGTWTEIFLKPDKPTKGSLLFLHGGPGAGEFALRTRQELLEYAYAGYEVDAVNYLDSFPVPRGRAARVQIKTAQHQILEAWQALRARTGTPPTILAESFGFQMIDEILKQPEPLSIIAMSPAMSAAEFLSSAKRSGLASGLPSASWPRVADIMSDASDIESHLCQRKAATALHIFAAKADPAFLAGGPAFLKRMEHCPRIAFAHTQVTGSEHATHDFYLNLLTVLGDKKTYTIPDNLDYDRK